MRIVSLLPSATEIVCALGADAELVGRSHECDFPEAITDRPALTAARIMTGTSSLEIDRAVRDVIENALSIYSVDEAQLAALAPDVIVTQDLCEVCAVSLDDVRAAVARLAHRKGIDAIQIVSLSPVCLADVMTNIVEVGAAIGRDGQSLRRSLEARMHALSSRVTARPRPRVVTLEWLAPLMIGGTWMPELVELAGGIALGATAGGPAPTIDLAKLRALAPDVIVAKPCGFTIARALEERSLLTEIQAAVPEARVYVTDGNAYFNRPGPRLVESLEILAACIHPELFPTPNPFDAIRI